MADLTGMLMAASGSGGGQPDPNFNQTVLLLHGDGTNGAQNNTFLDSSTNNFTITRNGNTTQGTFSPFSSEAGKWSNYFDGTDDRLSFAASSDFAFGTGDFTIEAWVNSNNVSNASEKGFIQISGTAGGLSTSYTAGVAIYFGNPANGDVRVSINGTFFATSGGPISARTWYHIALTRESGACTLWINGVSSATDTNASNLTAENLCVGGYYNTSYLYEGYLSNVSIIKGTAKYTSAFTPSTTPLSPSATNQKLLTCYSNRFVDANTATTAKAVTVAGNTSVQPFSPFAPSAAYSASVNGGSGYFDGSGDWLSVSASAMAFSTGDFTIQALVYLTGYPTSTYSYLYDARSANTASDHFLRVEATGILSYRMGFGTLGSTTATVPLNAWTLVSVTRASGTVKVYIDAVEANSHSGSTANLSIGSAVGIGCNKFDNTQGIKGYISNFRVNIGTAETITIPTAPLTAVSGTSLLLSTVNAGIFDNTGKNNLETVGNAQIDTTTKKYGTGSMEFDGTGDYLAIPASQDFAFGTGDFTFECWINTSVAPVTLNRRIIRIGANNVTGNFQVLLLTSEVLRVDTGATTLITGSADVVDGAWHHIAVTRNGTDLKLFVDGTQDGSTATNSTNFNQTVVQIGNDSTAAGTAYTGYIDDLRITKGVARYTTTFTPPTAAFPDL